MTAAEMTFGIEIECLIPRANAPACGGYHRGIQIPNLPQGWNAQQDSSIRSARYGMVGVEVVSPVLKGLDGLQQIKMVLDWLQSIGATVNRSTGLHIHVGFDRGNEQLTKKLVTVVANFEKAIYASTGTKSRETGCYCRSVQNSADHRNGAISRVSRYHVLNVQTNRPTVEFRAFAGTLSYVKIVAHIRTCLGLVEKTLATKKTPKWVAKQPVESSPIKRGGDGLTALNRLFYWLGWTKGREAATYGLVGEERVPSIKACKSALVRLARKYDTM
jgi:hypothetical protein